MTRMIERSCLVCGENLQIVLDNNDRIVSGGVYFGIIDNSLEDTKGEYWECIICYEED